MTDENGNGAESQGVDLKWLLEEVKRRKSHDQGRMATYRACRAAYFGDPEERRTPGVEGMDSAGRTTLRVLEIRKELAGRTGAPNLLTPIVDDYMYLRGSSPTNKVLPENEQEEAKEAANLRSKIIRAMWQNSAMDVQQLEAAWQLSCLGDTLYTLTPVFPEQSESFEPAGVYITVHDPATAYPQFRTGWNRLELEDVLIVEETTPEQAESEWKVQTTKKRVEVIHYMSRTRSSLVVDEKVVADVRHGLGFCPAQWLHNKVVGRMGQSDIAHVLDQHRNLQMMQLVMEDAIIEATYSQVVIENPASFAEQFEVGPGAPPIVVNAGGHASRLPPSPPPTGADMIIHRSWENIQHMTGSAPVRTESKIEGSNISARAIHAVQGPMETRLGGVQSIMATALQRLNAKILLMLHKLEGFNSGEPLTVWGQEQGRPFTVTFSPADLGGWWRNSVNFGAMIGSNTHEKIVAGLQLHGAGMVPKTWVLEQAGIDDPETLIHQAHDEHTADMKEQMAMQGPPPGAGGPPPGGPPGGGPEQVQSQAMAPADQGQALAAGALGGGGAGGPGGGPSDTGSVPLAGPTSGGPPPGMPGFPELSQAPGAGPDGPPPIADIFSKVSQALSQAAPRLRGHIINAEPISADRIAVTYTDQHDKQAIIRAFESQGLKTKLTLKQGHNPIPV